jgi:ABC-2 type transport system permease protein
MISDLETLVAIESIPAFADDIVWQLVSVMGVILMASVVGNEFSWRTVLTVTTWTGDRIRPLIAKFIVVALLAAIGVVLGFITAMVSSITMGILRGTAESSQFTGGLIADIGIAMLTTWYAAFPYIMLAGALAMLGRGAALGIGLGLAVLFLEGLGILVIDSFGDSGAWTKHLTMNWNVQAVLDVNGYLPGISSPPPPNLPSAWRAAAMLALFIVSYALVTVGAFRRRDITE